MNRNVSLRIILKTKKYECHFGYEPFRLITGHRTRRRKSGTTTTTSAPTTKTTKSTHTKTRLVFGSLCVPTMVNSQEMDGASFEELMKERARVRLQIDHRNLGGTDGMRAAKGGCFLTASRERPAEPAPPGAVSLQSSMLSLVMMRYIHLVR